MGPYQNRGFTLVELVAALVLLSLMASFALPYLGNGVRAYNDTARSLQTLGKLRYAGERVARELREIRRAPGGGFDIVTPVGAPGDRIRFVKSDGVRVTLDGSSPVVTLSYDSVAAETAFTLTDQLVGLTLNYYTRDGLTQATSVNDVAFIEFELVLNNGSEYSQRSRVALRNLR
ncbi:MAG: prepilin-type N-terminal cleavage/methylation domain-containing protein [Thiogranum sp.]|jgi:prepilin-type N-terminal cleavage/methylation domain-containing protein